MIRINNAGAGEQFLKNIRSADKEVKARLAKLSSGLRINQAADDAAGLAISEKLQAQITGDSQAKRNTQDAISLLQTAEGGLSQIQDITGRIRELSVQAANDTLTTEDRKNIQTEISQLTAEIDRTAQSTEFNNKKLLNGDAGANNGGLEIHTGANENQTTNINIEAVNSNSLNLNTIDVTTQSGAEQAIVNTNASVNEIATQRANIGATQNRVESIYNNLSQAEYNQQASQSRIADADVAQEIIGLTKGQILSQASIAAAAQFNIQAQNILNLL